MVPAANSYTADRAEFREKRCCGAPALNARPCRIGSALVSIRAPLQVVVELAPNEQREIVFLLGRALISRKPGRW
jgi:hypothetical protein